MSGMSLSGITFLDT
jgi:hypothetical protein